MLNVLDACLKCDIPELLLVSSPDVYGNDPAPGLTRLTVPDELDPYCAYGGGKIASEMLAIAWERWGSLGKLIIARPHNVFGPDMGTEHVIPQLIKQIMNHPDDHLELPLQGGGMTTRSFCYITDCVDQLITMLDQGDSPGIYNVGSGEGVLIGVVATAIAGYLGRTVHIVNGPPPQGPYRRVPDMDKTLALCGYGPRVSLSEGLERTVDSYKNHG
jgi:dTDP-glucose 4,6-dehydratase/UDP-glucose 4-epimerase